MPDQPATTFNHHREQIWQQLAEQLNATFHDEIGWERDRVTALLDRWRVVLDIHVYPGWHMQQHFTRLRTAFVNPQDFVFNVHRNGPLGQLADVTRLDRLTRDIKTGSGAFDRHFTIHANDPRKAQALFSNPRIQQLLEQAGDVRLEIRPDDGELGPEFPPGVDELRLEVADRVNNLTRLRAFYDLFSEILHTLCQLGTACDADPQVEL